MSYKTIGVVISDETGDLSALKAAIAITRREGGHLDVYCLGVDPMRYDMAPLGATPTLGMASSTVAHDRAETLVTWAEDFLKGSDVAFGVRPLVVTSHGLEASVARIVRYTDLIVAAQPYGPASTQLQVNVLEAALFGTGAPVLVVPRGERDYSQAFDRLMVAWNESDEALEAVRKAMPAFEDADRAEVVMVDPSYHSPERSDPGGAVCVMLARHGVKTEVSILSKTMPHVAEVLNRHATDHANDLIVMGAYGHSRFREALMGGATRDMLETAQVPILMAH